MLTIKRTCANKIITHVLTVGDSPFTAILPQAGDDCIVNNRQQSLQSMLDQNPGAFVIYNQHAQAKADVEALKADRQQVVIEVHQETRGVLGLEARYFGAADNDVIELVYRESA